MSKLRKSIGLVVRFDQKIRNLATLWSKRTNTQFGWLYVEVGAEVEGIPSHWASVEYRRAVGKAGHGKDLDSAVVDCWLEYLSTVVYSFDIEVVRVADFVDAQWHPVTRRL